MRYNSKVPLHQTLDYAHSIMTSKMTRLQKQQEALQLQQILKQIKITSNLIEKQVTGGQLPVTASYFLDQYQQLIQQAFNLQNTARVQKGLSAFTSKGQLFNRSRKTKTLGDNVFEEQIASIFSALDSIGGINTSIDIYLTGQKSSGTSAMSQVSKKLQEKTMEKIKIASQRWGNKTISSEVATDRAIKADIQRCDITLSRDVSSQLQRLHQLTAGKSFSLKSYSAYNQKNLDTGDINYSARSLGLGDTNLYKSITGSLSLLLDGVSSRKVLYRGMQILAGESVPPDTATPNEIARHFAHLRFIYELSGAGLLDQNGNKTFVDYIIYNDPSSENIAVRDTASIILEEMNNSARTNLFSGDVEIAASRIFANPLKNN